MAAWQFRVREAPTGKRDPVPSRHNANTPRSPRKKGCVLSFSLSFVASFILDLAVCAYLSKEVKRVHLSLGTSLFRFRLASDSARSRSSNLRIKQNGRGVFHNDKEQSLDRACSEIVGTVGEIGRLALFHRLVYGPFEADNQWMDRFRSFSGTLLSVDPCPSTQSGFSIGCRELFG